MNPNQIQQGDILARVVTSLPEGSTRLTTKIVAGGSTAGNSHAFNGNVSLFEAPDKTLFAVNDGAETEAMVHQEHGPVTTEAGQIIEFGHVIEKDWFQDMVRPVVD